MLREIDDRAGKRAAVFSPAHGAAPKYVSEDFRIREFIFGAEVPPFPLLFPFSSRRPAILFARKRDESRDIKINRAKGSFHRVGAVRSSAFTEFHTADVLILLTGSIEK